MMNRFLILTALLAAPLLPAAAQEQTISIPTLDDIPAATETYEAPPADSLALRQQAAPEGTLRIDEDTPPDSLWSQANAAYSRSDFSQAVDLYTAIVQRGMRSAKLYYNLGNAYYKQNRLGKAILNYQRALLLDPGDEDTRYNLAMANARIVDKIDTVPEFFLKTWMRDLALTMSSNAWAILTLVFLGLLFAGLLLWLLSNTLSLRKLGFWGGIVCLLLCLTSLFFASFQRQRLLYGNEAIVMNLVAPVKSSPGEGSRDLFVLHEGTKVRVLQHLDGWSEIVLSDGNKGWISESAIEAVNQP